jgi:hypothetical protein
MKYKLINRITNEKHFCAKVILDGFDYYVNEFDYYVSDEQPKRKDCCITSTNAVYQSNQESLNNRLVFIDKEVINYHEVICRVIFNDNAVNLPFDISELKKVIATNNALSIELPKVVDEVEEMAKEVAEIEGKWGLDRVRARINFLLGYKKSQETHPFSEDDMIEFLEWYKNHLVQYPTKDLLEIWKDQQIKTIYYDA